MSAQEFVHASKRLRDDHAKDWQRYEQLLDRIERRGIGTLGPAEVEALPALHRLVLTSLGTARSSVLEDGLIRYLETLAARGNLFVNLPREGLTRACLRFLAVEFPKATRALRGPVVLATLVFLAGTIAGYAACAVDPSAFHDFVAPGLAGSRGPSSSTEHLESTLYDTSGSIEEHLFFSAQLYRNNSQVLLLGYALGLLFGIPTLFLLVMNGAMLGAFAWLFASRGLGVELAGWILPHGVPEIGAILLGGAGGLEIARAVLRPHPEGRLVGIGIAGRRATMMVFGALALVFYASFIEGIVRQTITDTATRYAIATVHLMALLGWILLAARGPRKHAR